MCRRHSCGLGGPWMREKVLVAVTPHTSWATEGRGALTPPAPVDVALCSQFDLSFLNAGRRFPYSAAACQVDTGRGRLRA